MTRYSFVAYELNRLHYPCMLGVVVLTLVAQIAMGQIDVLGDDRFSFSKNGQQITLRHYTTHNIEIIDTEISKAIIVVHGTNRNADDYFGTMKAALSNRPDEENHTVIVAPQFITEDDVSAFDIAGDHPYWSSDGWKVGSNSRNEDSQPRSFRIPSYEVLDTMIMQMVRSFPNLKQLTFTGHSAGGQLTNRYTASSPIFQLLCEEHDISSKSIIANPGSYVYLSPQRRIEGSLDQFEIPAGCSDYNEYSYGLEDLYTYHDRSGADQMLEWYGARDVTYLFGAEDNDPDATTLPRSCRAMLQGDHRLERGMIYFNHILDTYGAEVMDLHHMTIVPDVGHSHSRMYLSTIGLEALFDVAPVVNCSDQTTPTEETSVDQSLTIYPNPTSNFIHIKGPSRLSKKLYLEINNHLGQLVFSNAIGSNPDPIDIAHLENGLYIVRIGNGNIYQSTRMIKL